MPRPLSKECYNLQYSAPPLRYSVSTWLDQEHITSQMSEGSEPTIRRISSYTRDTLRHRYPFGWRQDDWMVPFDEGEAVIHHSHTSPDDHSLCGPIIFCCRRSAGVYAELFPSEEAARGAWRPTPAEQIISWIDAGVPLINVVFCYPLSPHGIYIISLSSEEARKTLRKEIPFEALAPRARPL